MTIPPVVTKSFARVRSLTNVAWIDAVLVAAITFVSRIPFLESGYGRDPDAWRIVYSAYHISTTGEYVASRLPGYPLPEFGFALLYLTSPKLLPVAAVLSAVAAGFFVLVATRSGCRDVLLAGVAMAMTPVVYINSTNAMDYIWAVALIMPAWWCVLGRRPIIAGVLLGLATGARVTSVVMLVPFVMMLLEARRGAAGARREILRLLVTTLAVAALAYLPVWLRYGVDMFAFVDDRSGARVLYLLGEGVWGKLGLIALALAFAGLFLRRVRGLKTTSIPGGETAWRAWGVAVLCYLALFWRLPVESGYLIVTVPLVILLAARFVPRALFIGFCLLLTASSWVDVQKSGVYPGPILQNGYVRQVYLKDCAVILRSAELLDDEPAAVVSGWLTPQLQLLRLFEEVPPLDKDVVFVKDLEELYGQSRRVYVLPIDSVVPPAQRRVMIEAGASELPLRVRRETPPDNDRSDPDSGQ